MFGALYNSIALNTVNKTIKNAINHMNHMRETDFQQIRRKLVSIVKNIRFCEWQQIVLTIVNV